MYQPLICQANKVIQSWLYIGATSSILRVNDVKTILSVQIDESRSSRMRTPARYHQSIQRWGVEGPLQWEKPNWLVVVY